MKAHIIRDINLVPSRFSMAKPCPTSASAAHAWTSPTANVTEHLQFRQ
jgi:hypothetical protein